MQRSIPFRILPLIALLLAGCHQYPESAYYDRGEASQLLDVSSEVVNLSVAGPADITALTTWVERDNPSRAELYCNAGEPRCRSARHVLDAHGVPTMLVPSGDYTVALVYERILARDCKQRYTDSSHNYSWVNEPEIGCSVAANLVQHVSDKKEFVNPELTDVPPATGAISAYRSAYAPPERAAAPSYTLEQSTLSQTQTTAGGGGQ